MAAQRRQGHDVYLLTLTRGEATKVRHKFGWSLEEMGAARHREMQDVKATLELADMRILNLPDGQLKELDPWRVEDAIREEMLRVKPHVVVTFPIHGISGFHDHIVTHSGCHAGLPRIARSGARLVAATGVLHACRRRPPSFRGM
jgi:LmbE family N-acetylglucosaminyl deacetylase